LKVFVVIFECAEEIKVINVFSSMEKAKKRAIELNKETLYIYSIEEHEVI